MLGGELDVVVAAGQTGILVHPDQRRFELVRGFDGLFAERDHVAAGGVDFTVKPQCDGITRGSRSKRPVHGDEFGNLCRLSGGGDADFIADADRSISDGAAESAEICIGTVDPLHRKHQPVIVRL